MWTLTIVKSIPEVSGLGRCRGQRSSTDRGNLFRCLNKRHFSRECRSIIHFAGDPIEPQATACDANLIMLPQPLPKHSLHENAVPRPSIHVVTFLSTIRRFAAVHLSVARSELSNIDRGEFYPAAGVILSRGCTGTH